MGTGLFVGVILGMAIAGGMYWYLVGQRGDMKAIESAPEIIVPKDSPAPAPVAPTRETAAPKQAEPPPSPETRPDAKPAPKVPAEAQRVTPPRDAARKPELPPPSAKATESRKPATPDYSFYDILPGKTAPKPATPVKPKEQYWLQVAALKSEADAERLKARLALLGLPVSMQKVASGEMTLHRVRVGPYASEDAGLGALDTLSENDFEPRWVKDPVSP